MINVLIDEIKLTLPEDRVIVSGINFNVEKNQVFTIVGKNGSGKSTLLKSLPGLLDERFYLVKGKVLFRGNDIYSMNKPDLLSVRKNSIKYVMQDAVNSFDHLKKFRYYFENITGAQTGDEDKLLEYFLLPSKQKLFNLYPYEVSGGMAQRISFVLALLCRPEIILFDEPTSGIDSAIANLFLLKLKEYVSSGNNCAVLVTHDLKFAEKAGDRFALISEGKLSAISSPDKYFSSTNSLYN